MDTTGRRFENETRRVNILMVMRDHQWHSATELSQVGGQGSRARISELRKRGWVIGKRKKAGSDDYEYIM